MRKLIEISKQKGRLFGLVVLSGLYTRLPSRGTIFNNLLISVSDCLLDGNSFPNAGKWTYRTTKEPHSHLLYKSNLRLKKKKLRLEI